MKLKVLVDNNTYIDNYCLGEPAVSYYIEDEGTKILFDVGYSDIFIANALKLEVDLKSIDTIVFSHGHNDHTRGITYYFEEGYKNKVSIYAHPDALNEKIVGDLMISAPINKLGLREKSDLELSKEPLKISKNITFLGEIPQSNDFEKRKPIGKQKINGELIDDYVMDDTAVAYQTKNGIYIITGCSHSGICNIVEYATKICKDNRVLGIIGGFHLFELSNQVEKTIQYFKDKNIKELYPCHCTSFGVKAEMNKFIPIKEVGVGLELQL